MTNRTANNATLRELAHHQTKQVKVKIGIIPILRVDLHQR
jgi:hypothetical protein